MMIIIIIYIYNNIGYILLSSFMCSNFAHMFCTGLCWIYFHSYRVTLRRPGKKTGNAWLRHTLRNTVMINSCLTACERATAWEAAVLLLLGLKGLPCEKATGDNNELTAIAGL